jgi:hypothetical protein
MPHIFDFDAIEHRLFALQHLSFGSRDFCRKYKIDRGVDEPGEYEWSYYFDMLKSLVSSTMIDAAVKLRMVQDFIRSEQEHVDLAGLDRGAVKGLNIGEFVGKSEVLTLRKSCNKIIHATDATLRWKEDESEGVPIEY